jgi:hypothetical protein
MFNSSSPGFQLPEPSSNSRTRAKELAGYWNDSVSEFQDMANSGLERSSQFSEQANAELDSSGQQGLQIGENVRAKREAEKAKNSALLGDLIGVAAGFIPGGSTFREGLKSGLSRASRFIG